MTVLHGLPGIRSPLALASFVAVALIILLTIRGARRGSQARALLGITKQPSFTLSRVAVWLSLIALSFATLRPYVGYEDLIVETRGSEVVLLVDVSRSMYAEDVAPNRIELAKRKLKDIIDQFAKRGETHRFGITVFAGDAYTVCPITADQGVIKQFIDIISPELVTGLGSNLGAGIALAVSRFDRQHHGAHRVILLTDGEHSDADMSKALSDVKERGVRLDILGIGTVAGSTVTLPNGSFVTDQSRRPVVSKLDEESLKALATAAGGIYKTAVVDDSDVEAITSSSPKSGQSITSGKSTIRSYREFGSWLSLGALVFLIIPLLARRGTALLAALLSLTLYSSQASASPQPALTQSPGSDSPFTLYEQGDYSRAVEAFARDAKRSPNDRALQFGLASSLFKAGRYAESQRIFQELSQNAQDGRSYFESTYNEGNALLALGRYQDAIDAYLKALDVKPDDQAARHNLSVARALLEDERANPKTPTPTNTPTATFTNTPDPQNSPDAAPTPTPSEQETAAPTPTQEGTPSSATTPEQSPSSSPDPKETNRTESGTPSPASSEAAEQNGSPTPNPNQTPSVTQVPGTPGGATPTPEGRLKEAIESPAVAEASASPDISPTAGVETSTEADAWLESLPDSPLLVRRHRGSPSRSDQTW